MWFQETEHCATCCKAILEEAIGVDHLFLCLVHSGGMF